MPCKCDECGSARCRCKVERGIYVNLDQVEIDELARYRGERRYKNMW